MFSGITCCIWDGDDISTDNKLMFFFNQMKKTYFIKIASRGGRTSDTVDDG